jgi:hypothetical protein
MPIKKEAPVKKARKKPDEKPQIDGNSTAEQTQQQDAEPDQEQQNGSENNNAEIVLDSKTEQLAQAILNEASQQAGENTNATE